jgi:hypothetical protein
MLLTGAILLLAGVSIGCRPSAKQGDGEQDSS